MGRPNRSRSARLLAAEARRLLVLAGPIIVSQLGHVAMNTSDTIMVGPLGATSLAAAGLGSAIHWLITIVCFGTLLGGSPLMSQAFGARDIAKSRRVLAQVLWLALLLGVPVTLVSFAGRAIALTLGQDPVVSELTGGYLIALAFGILPYFLFTAFREYLEAMGHVKVPMIITFIALGLNILFNWLLIYGVEGVIPAMGLVGSGWATAIARWCMLFAILGFFLSRSEIRFHHHDRVRPDAHLLRRILRLGLPVGGQFGLEMGLFSFAAIMMGWLGPLELAAHQVTINIASTTFMVALGVSLAGSIRVAQNIGARRPRRMRRAVIVTYALAVGFMGVCAMAFVIAPGALISLYTRDPAITLLGAQLLLVAAAFQMFDGAQVAGVSVLRGAAQTRVSAIVAGFGYWAIGVPLGYLLAFQLQLGPAGVWLGLTGGLFVVALLLAWRARQVFWHSSFSELHAG